MNNLPFKDELNAEVDRRKMEDLLDAGRITLEELATAPIVLACACGTEQPVENDTCVNCGRDLS